MSTIGERIKKAVKLKNITAVYLAEKTGVSQSTISFYFHNRSFPNEKFFEALVILIPEINLHWLITGDGAMFLDGNETKGEDVNVLKKEIEHLKEVQNSLMRTLDTLTSIDKRSFNKVVRETGDKINLLDEKLVRVIPFLNLYRKGTVERTA